jgi:ABC-2 type transport system ATP-binding protein
MTTHYIEEAEILCDRVAIIDVGQIIAMGTPRELQERTLGHSTIEVTLLQAMTNVDLPMWAEAIATRLSEDRRQITVTSRKAARTLVEIIKWVDHNAMELEDVHMTRPTLEDVFIELTGRKLRE